MFAGPQTGGRAGGAAGPRPSVRREAAAIEAGLAASARGPYIHAIESLTPRRRWGNQAAFKHTPYDSVQWPPITVDPIAK